MPYVHPVYIYIYIYGYTRACIYALWWILASAKARDISGVSREIKACDYLTRDTSL